MYKAHNEKLQRASAIQTQCNASFENTINTDNSTFRHLDNHYKLDTQTFICQLVC